MRRGPLGGTSSRGAVAGADSTVSGRHNVRLGHEEEEDDDTDKRARGGSDTESREGQGSRGEAACGFGWAGP
jgi:hypothetical protein